MSDENKNNENIEKTDNKSLFKKLLSLNLTDGLITDLCSAFSFFYVLKIVEWEVVL